MSERTPVDPGNATTVAWPDGDYPALVGRHATTTPDAPAVVHGEVVITFRELDERSNQVAHRLVALGVTEGDRVGLLGSRCAAFVVTALGVLKARAAVVPLDLANPDARIAAMVEDARPALVVTEDGLRSRLPEGVRTLRPDAVEIAAEPVTPVPGPAIGPDVVSHLIYTSGSTGRPKAVRERHGALVNLVHWTGRAYGVRAGDRASWLSTTGFAVQIMEWMPYLGLGAAVHVGEVGDATPEQVRDWLVGRGITHTMLVAGLAERVWPLEFPADAALRIMVTTAERVHSWPPADTAFRVVMTYGSTETTNVLTCLDLGAGIDLTAQATPAAVRAAHPVPVGVPIANLRAYLLDDDDRPVLTTGEVGRLHVAGAGLAEGYHDRPELTAAKFRANPLPEEPDAVLYDTGDLARYRADGAIELLGRSDSQVKVRGFRVELGEVETVLAAAPGVIEAVVTAVDEQERGVRLVAHVAPADLSMSAVRAHLVRRLPGYMVPATFMPLAGLPRLANGKVDHQALPTTTGVSRAALGTELTGPRDELEVALAGVWSTLFDLEEIGIHDNFFELGGHSLLAFRLIDLVRTTLDAELSLPDLYRCPTVALLAELVREGLTTGRSDFGGMSAIVPDPASHHETFPLTDSQQALWIGRGDAVELGNVGCHGYFEWESDHLVPERFDTAWRLLVERHAALRTIVLPDGTQQVLTSPPHYEIAVLDLRDRPAGAADAELEELREHLSHTVMPDGAWPLFDVRLSLLPVDGRGIERVRIHLSLDFLIADAWSYFQVLVPDLVQLYESPDSAQPLTLTFRDYVLGVAERLPDSDVYKRSEQYWKERVATLPPAPELPARPASQPSLPTRFDRRAHTLDPVTWERLKSLSTEQGVTPSGLMTSVFAEVLHAWTGQQRFTINFPIFNRIPLHPEVNQLIGDTTTTLLLAVDGSDATFVDRARAVQAQMWTALEHRYFSGVQVLRELCRLRGSMVPAMPVVLTSLLGHPPRHFAASLGRATYSISQTPQVSLDFQIFEVAGELQFNWDFLPGLFPDGLVEAMFDAYCDVLTRLIDDPDAWQTPEFAIGPVDRPVRRSAEPVADAATTRDTGEAWERYWTGISTTGAGGDVLWDADSDSEIAWCVEQAIENMDRSLPVIDLGCGNGRFARALAEHFPAVIGVDVSASAVDRAAAESLGCPRASFQVLDATRPEEATALADEIGDANIFVRGVLHVLDDAAREEFVRSVSELVGDRGTLILLEPAYDHGSFGYMGFVGGTVGRALDLVRPLEFAGVGASMPFADEELHRFFPADGGWHPSTSGPVGMAVLDPDAEQGALQAPGYFAVVSRARALARR